MDEKRFIRGAGILLAITSLPSPYGIGTLGKEAFQFVDLLVELRQRYWQVLPIGPTSFGDSPYQSFSAFAGSPYLIDLNILAEEELLLDSELKEFGPSLAEEDIDYGYLFEHRFKILNRAFERFDCKNEKFLQFCKENEAWLGDYSLFMALKNFFDNQEWLLWDEDIRNHRDPAVSEYTQMLAGQILFWKFTQYKFFEQWNRLKEYANRKGILIIGDIPLYVALDSADVWAGREQFLLGRDGKPTLVAGCPPDAFSDDGQKWGNPLYDWNYMEKDKFGWWYKRMCANAAVFDIIRIDHFIGIVRYFSIPAQDETARGGKWNKGPGKKLTDVIDQAVGTGRIIAEDLGVAVPAVKKLLRKIKWPGMKILLFAFDGNTANEHLPHNYEDGNAAVYTGTHDNETIMGFFGSKANYELAFLFEYLDIHSLKEIPDAIIRKAYSGTADVVIIQMQDILKLGNDARMNFPSTIGNNWRWRMKENCLSEERRRFIRTLSLIYRR